MKRQLSLALAAIALLSMAVGVGSAAAQGPGTTVEIESVEASVEAPVEGDNITVTVTLFNNVSAPVLLANLTVGVFAAGADPEIIVQLDNVTLAPSNRTVFVFHWVAKPGTRSITATASISLGNSSAPLPPASTTVLVGRAQINDPGTVAGGIVAVLVAVFILAALPAVLETVRGGRGAGGRTAAEYDDDGGTKAPAAPKEPPK